MGGGERVKAKSRLHRFKDKPRKEGWMEITVTEPVQDRGFRADVVGADVFSVGGKPRQKSMETVYFEAATLR